jgi:hypothetical protein
VFYLGVAYVITHMLQVFLSRCCICFAMATHVFFRVSDVCCKCFNCFGHMLQIFPLDVAKVDLVLHMLQTKVDPVCC